MQRSFNDQGRPGVCLSMHLSVVGWTRTKYFGQGNNFIRWSQEMGDTSRKGGGAMETQKLITRVHRKVQANHWCMWMSRGREGHGTQERCSPRSKESKSLSKVFEEDQDSLTTERVIEIATLLYDSASQRSIMQTLSTATATATAIQQGSTQIHKVQTKHQKGGESIEWSNRDKTAKDKEHSETKWQTKVDFLVEQSLLTPDRSARPRMSLVTSVERKDITKSAARAKQVNKVRPVNLGRFEYMVYKHRWQEPVPIRLQFVIMHKTTTWCSVHMYHRKTNTQCFTILRLFMWRVLMILQASTSSLFG